MSGDPGLRLGIVPLRPLTVAELVGGALDAVRRNPGALLGVGFGVAVLAEVASWLAVLVVFGGRPAPADLSGDIGHVLASYGAVLLRTAVVGVVGVVLAAAVNTAVPRAVFGHTTSARAALRAGGARCRRCSASPC
ncbi:hypothetical protein ACFQV2_29010 [Actinokineospora soli]|uniref:Uncharacterized protein n=1 Tax=Actinokineospora soli TaxID=1048753 RepID=A0ABW2TTT0_9PSEU